MTKNIQEPQFIQPHIMSENDESLFNQKSGLSKDHTNESLNMLDTSNYKAAAMNRGTKSMYPGKKMNQTTNI